MGLVLRYVKCTVIEMFVFQIHPSSVRTTQQLIVMVKMNVTFHGTVSCLIDYSYVKLNSVNTREIPYQILLLKVILEVHISAAVERLLTLGTLPRPAEGISIYLLYSLPPIYQSSDELDLNVGLE